MPTHWLQRDELLPTVRTHITPVESVLDIGCGLRPQRFFKPKLHVCCEPFEEYVRLLHSWFSHMPDILVVQSTGEPFLCMLPDRSFDSIFLVDVIEHLTKEDGLRLLKQCERVVRKQIVVFTPLGFLEQDYDDNEPDAWGLHGGKWQTHRSGWEPQEFGENWNVYACREYHSVDVNGNAIDPPVGAFWAIYQAPAIKAAPPGIAVMLPANRRRFRSAVPLAEALTTDAESGRCIIFCSPGVHKPLKDASFQELDRTGKLPNATRAKFPAIVQTVVTPRDQPLQLRNDSGLNVYRLGFGESVCSHYHSVSDWDVWTDSGKLLESMLAGAMGDVGRSGRVKIAFTRRFMEVVNRSDIIAQETARLGCNAVLAIVESPLDAMISALAASKARVALTLFVPNANRLERLCMNNRFLRLLFENALKSAARIWAQPKARERLRAWISMETEALASASNQPLYIGAALQTLKLAATGFQSQK